jgi:hypothetical protein
MKPGIVIYRRDDRLFFANARQVKGKVLEAVRGAHDPARWLILRRRERHRRGRDRAHGSRRARGRSRTGRHRVDRRQDETPCQ